MIDYKKEFKLLDKKTDKALGLNVFKNTANPEYENISILLNEQYKNYKKNDVIPFDNMNLFKEYMNILLDENKSNVKPAITVLKFLIEYYNSNRLYNIEEDDEISIEIYKYFYKILIKNNGVEYESDLEILWKQLNTLYMIVNDKQLLLVLVQSLFVKESLRFKYNTATNNLLEFLIKARLCFNDDNSYVVYCMNLINSKEEILKNSDPQGIERYINDLLCNKYLSKENITIDENVLIKCKELIDNIDKYKKTNEEILTDIVNYLVDYDNENKPDEITDYVNGFSEVEDMIFFDILIKKAKEKGYLFHEQFKEILKAYLEIDDLVIYQEKESGFTTAINQMSDIFNIPVYKIDYNYLLQLIKLTKNDLEKTNLYQSIKEDNKRGIFLVETSCNSTNIEEINKEIDDIYDLLDQLNDNFDKYFNINLIDYLYFIVNKVDKIKNDYNHGSKLLKTINFKSDEKLEQNIVNNNQLYQFIVIVKICYDLTTKDIANIVNYYNTNMFSLHEIFDITFGYKVKDDAISKMIIKQYSSLNNEILLEFIEYLNRKNKTRKNNGGNNIWQKIKI